MGSVDDSSASSFEDVGDRTDHHFRKSAATEKSDDVMSDFSGNLGKVVADQVKIKLIFLLFL